MAKSKKILEGNLKELKREYSEGQIRIDLKARLEEVAAIPGVAAARAVNGSYMVTLAPGANRREFLRHAVDRYEVTYFSEREPELEEIYLSAVQKAGLVETRTIE